MITKTGATTLCRLHISSKVHKKINFQKTKIELDNLEECKGFFA